MAGESPDKSVDEGAVGEGRDPRVSVFRPRDPEPEPEAVDPLREAVAAWVASEAQSDAEGDADAGGDADSDSDSGDAAEAVSGSGSPGRVESKPSADDAEERTAVFRAVKPTPAEPKPNASASAPAKPASGASADEKRDSASAQPAAADQRTTAFGVVKPAATGEPADSERTAVFRAPKPVEAKSESKPEPKPEPKSDASASASAKPASGASADEKPDSASAKPAATGEPADSERTAVFRAPKPVEAKPEPKPESKSGASASGPAKPASGASGAEKRDSVDQRTTAFGVVKPAATGEPADSERTAVFRAPKPVEAKSESKPEPKPEPKSGASASASAKPASGASGDDKPAAADQRTTAFGVVKPAPAKPAAGDEPADSERTAVFRAVKPAEAAKASEAAKSAKPAKPEAGGSTFVPLRGDGAAAPKPPAAPRPPQASASAPPRVSLEPGERTTQQPLPPKPPLDMLADLTNNPPPPPSPLRTAVRRFKIYAPVVVLLAVILAVVQLVRPLPEPKLTMTAKKTYTFDGGAPAMPWPKEGQAYMAAAGLGTVGTFGEQKPVAIGSVAKAMTAYVILKGHPLKKGEKGAMIDVDKAAVEDGKKESEGESTVNTLKEGGQISEYDALAAIMIPSANNVARLLARWDGNGDQEAFVKKMNDAAKELGMTNTTYTDPSGLDASTVSTAEDQVKLGLKIVEMPELIAITRLPNWTDASGKTWRNYNDLIPFNGSLGIKTGSTTKAGGNLLFAAEKKVGATNQLIVGAVLGQHGVPILGTAIDASRQVMLATQKMLTNAPVVKKGDVVGYVDDGLGGHTPVIATADVEAVGWPTLTVNVKLGDDGAKLPQTARAGTEVGVLTVGEGASQVKVPVALKGDLVSPGIGSKLTRVG
ncbi:hypothetical protein ACFWC9_32010 [Streptomyces goshikiensis]|uniref:D-alanyl-D-alanine carboxypeptidase n=1 Tax=Streptomyces goshikiensis TaxID=1942 RepID=UPI0036CF34D5